MHTTKFSVHMMVKTLNKYKHLILLNVSPNMYPQNSVVTHYIEIYVIMYFVYLYTESQIKKSSKNKHFFYTTLTFCSKWLQIRYTHTQIQQLWVPEYPHNEVLWYFVNLLLPQICNKRSLPLVSNE
jgi:hypothetical protein